MDFAPGMKEALAKEEALVDPVEAAAFWSCGGAEVPTRDLEYTGGSGQPQRLRLYRGGGADAPSLLYIHGGGWVGGSIELHDRSARGLAVAGGCNVVSISYRFAPQHPFPAALEDVQAAARWLRVYGAEHGLNTGSFAIGGASAGGNLAVAAALAEPGAYSGLLNIYGALGCDFDTESYRVYENGPGLGRTEMIGYFDLYDPAGLRTREPLISPLLTERLDALPPTVVITAEHDVLRDDNRQLAARLQDLGVPTRYHEEPGVTHGFINRGRLVPSADACIARAARLLKSLIQDP